MHLIHQSPWDVEDMGAKPSAYLTTKNEVLSSCRLCGKYSMTICSLHLFLAICNSDKRNPNRRPQELG
jgi:hypothetical protein